MSNADVSPPPSSRIRRPGRAGRSASPTDSSTPNRRQIAVTSFDLLNGAYQTAARGRIASLIGLSAILIVLALFGVSGLQSRLATSSVMAEVNAYEDRQREATAKFTAFAGLPDGVTEKQLFARYELLKNDFERISVTAVEAKEFMDIVAGDEISVTDFRIELRTTIGKVDSEESKSDAQKLDKNSISVTKELVESIESLNDDEVLVLVQATAVARDPILLARWAQTIRDSKKFTNVVIVRNATSYTITAATVQRGAPPKTEAAFEERALPLAVPPTDSPEESTAESGDAEAEAGATNDNNTAPNGPVNTESDGG